MSTPSCTFAGGQGENAVIVEISGYGLDRAGYRCANGGREEEEKGDSGFAEHGQVYLLKTALTDSLLLLRMAASSQRTRKRGATTVSDPPHYSTYQPRYLLMKPTEVTPKQCGAQPSQEIESHALQTQTNSGRFRIIIVASRLGPVPLFGPPENNHRRHCL